MRRRSFLEGTCASAVGLLAAARAEAFEREASEPWRRFEAVTRLEIRGASGATRAWVPLPLASDTEYQRHLGDSWTGNAARVHVWRDPVYGAAVLCADWPGGLGQPSLAVTSRVATRNRVTGGHPAGREADARTLGLCLQGTRLLPVDGVVLETAREITRGREGAMEKAQAIYDWVVDNTYRDPAVPGCGKGDVRSMLETRTFGGKCADISALFVGLARAAGVPAREVFGIRVAESKLFRSLGRSGDVTRAQHCRAEFYAEGRWIAVDPADVRKVALEEPPGGRSLDDPLVQSARRQLFGAWEMNYLAYNRAHDLALPGATSGPLPFLMYPQCESDRGRKDSLQPDTFAYTIHAREIA